MDNQISSNFLIWLEEREHTVSFEKNIAKRKGFDWKIAADPTSLIHWINQTFHNEIDVINCSRLGFVIDLMIHGYDHFEDVNIFDAPTNAGIDAGLIFVDRYLRSNQGALFFDIPICILTDREIDSDLEENVKYLREDRGGATIFLVRKLAPDNLFEEFLSYL